MEQKDYYEALGLTPPEGGEGGKKQDNADPATSKPSSVSAETPSPEGKASGGGKGGKEQPVAGAEIANASAEALESPDGDAISKGDQSPFEEPPALRGGEDKDDEKDAGTAEKSRTEQTKEERARNAAARRKAETEAAIASALQELKAQEDKRWEEFFKRARLTNPLDGNKPIRSLEEFEAYERARDAAQLQKNLKAGTLTPEDLGRIVAESEPIKKVTALLEETEKQKNEAQKAAFEARVKPELEKIREYDPTIQTIQDFAKLDRAKEFYEKVKRGYTFLDAYESVYRDRIEAGRAAAARQQAMNNARSKDHLNSTTQRGGGGVAVPADVMAIYKALNPDATEAEIRQHYNKSKK